MEQGDLFNQPDPPALDPAAAAVLGGEQRARARDLRRKKKRLGPDGLPPTIQDRFEAFHLENPHVYRELVAIALEAKRSGQYEGGWSISGAYEVARYRSLQTTGQPFKLSNDFRSRYSRKIMDEIPELAGFFRLREITTI